ncbi:unnamed protein product [Malus baccata var. baccata]
MELVPFWVQIRGVPLYLSTDTNVRRLAKEVGSKARGDAGSQGRTTRTHGLNFDMSGFKIFAIDAQGSAMPTMNVPLNLKEGARLVIGNGLRPP